MKKWSWWKMAGLSGLAFSLASVAFGRAKDDQDFPDYNHLEYAKPMPAPDQQIQAPPPGSIHMEVGGKKSVDHSMPIDELPIAIHPVQPEDTSEPSMDFFDTGAPSPTAVAAAPVVSTVTLSVATPPPAALKP